LLRGGGACESGSSALACCMAPCILVHTQYTRAHLHRHPPAPVELQDHCCALLPCVLLMCRARAFVQAALAAAVAVRCKSLLGCVQCSAGAGARRGGADVLHVRGRKGSGAHSICHHHGVPGRALRAPSMELSARRCAPFSLALQHSLLLCTLALVTAHLAHAAAHLASAAEHSDTCCCAPFCWLQCTLPLLQYTLASVPVHPALRAVVYSIAAHLLAAAHSYAAHPQTMAQHLL